MKKTKTKKSSKKKEVKKEVSSKEVKKWIEYYQNKYHPARSLYKPEGWG